MKRLLEDWQNKALFGFVAAFITFFFGVVVVGLIIEMGVYFFILLFAVVFFYIVGHFVYEKVEERR